MKCPKCGFNSFEYYDACKKCSTDLIGYKQTFSIVSLILPLEAKEKLIAESQSLEGLTDLSIAGVEAHDDIFSFDLPDDTPASATQRNDDPFNFDAPLPEINQASTRNEDDVFANLLESTSQSEDALFSSPAAVTPTTIVSATNSASGPGEFDLESFSWDETPVAPAASGNVDAEADDDFDSLFGDTKESTSK